MDSQLISEVAQIRGARYRAFFTGVRHEKTVSYSHDPCKRLYYWEGKGIVEDNAKDEFFELTVHTPFLEIGKSARPYNFKSSLIYFAQHGPVDADWTQNHTPLLIPGKYPELADLILYHLVEQHTEQQSPISVVPRLKLSELVMRGICVGAHRNDEHIHLMFAGSVYDLPGTTAYNVPRLPSEL